jgi:cytochrome c oxidase subunit III
MSASLPLEAHAAPAETPEENYHRRTVNNRLGLWLFLISDSFVFAGLFIARFYLFGADYRPDVNQVVGLIVTGVLGLSSFFANRGEIAMQYGDTKAYFRNTLITMILGLIFLVGVVGVEWQIAPKGPGENALWSLFYTMTGFHAFHVLTGVIFLALVFRNARKGRYSAEQHFPVEAAAVYWHFVDVVWIFFYPALYLIGRPPL